MNLNVVLNRQRHHALMMACICSFALFLSRNKYHLFAPFSKSISTFCTSSYSMVNSWYLCLMHDAWNLIAVDTVNCVVYRTVHFSTKFIPETARIFCLFCDDLRRTFSLFLSRDWRCYKRQFRCGQIQHPVDQTTPWSLIAIRYANDDTSSCLRECYCVYVYIYLSHPRLSDPLSASLYA